MKAVFSTKPSVKEAVSDIKSQLAGYEARAVLYFASPTYDFEELAGTMENSFATASTFGCSTAGEIVSGRLLKNSLVAMAFGRDTVEDIAVETVEDISGACDVKKAFSAFEKHFGEQPQKMDYRKYLGIVLADGLSMAEEKLIEKIGDLTDVPFVGGSAGDNLEFKKTYVCAGPKALSNAAVLALIKAGREFEIIKTQSFDALNKKLLATKVDESKRVVLEFNNRPAVEAYALAVGVPPSEVQHFFMTHPVGVLAGDDIYVRSPRQVEGKGLAFYCSILEGMEVNLLQDRDIVGDTWYAIKAAKKKMGRISGLVVFNCILRTLALEKNGETGAYGGLFADVPSVGFSTYGEAYNGHINQTATMIAFK